MSPPHPPEAGALIVDKPSGPTSHDVVDRVREVAGTRRVGHAGTLDPAASGVLVVAFGPATRFLEYLADDSKTYAATVRLGIRTDSHDLEGKVTARADAAGVSELDLRATLAILEGPQMQIPPMFSAVKVDGQPLYRRARRGDEVLRAPRPVTVHRLELLRFAPPDVELCIECSKGTYIRVLADSLGKALGCGAVLAALRRTRSGRFTLRDAVPLDDLSAEHARDMAFLLGYLDAVVLDEIGAVRFRHGGEVQVSPGDPEHVRVHGPGGAFLGVGRRQKDRLRPEKVLAGRSSQG